MMTDLGGEDDLSEGQKALIQRACTLAVECERLDGLLSIGEKIDLDLYSRMSSALRRILETVGLKRVPRNVVPTLSEYVAANYSKDNE
jgi:hypothetical protein